MPHKIFENMTREEKLECMGQFLEAQQSGSEEKIHTLRKIIPLHPMVASVLKENFGSNFLLSGEYNLSQVEATYGKEWLNK